MLPGPNDGYKILPAPAGYAPIRTPARKLMATPTPFGQTPLYQIPEEDRWVQLRLYLQCWLRAVSRMRDMMFGSLVVLRS